MFAGRVQRTFTTFPAECIAFNSESMESVVRLLVEHGCDINYHNRNDVGETPWHLAATSHMFNLDILSLLLVQGAEPPVHLVNFAVQGIRYPPVPGQDGHTIAIQAQAVDCRPSPATTPYINPH
ncbi:hypothetical protein J3R83DRAFT_13589 [Lanmaoa asiatica]|nr:hypothetical protein J3R83DRAFT_13589 [Lanmaoa asiatica]